MRTFILSLAILSVFYKLPNFVIADECDPQLSDKPFTNWNFKQLEGYDFNGKTICNSNFYNEQPNADIFPIGMTGVTFKGCNLTNVVIPDGNTVIDCIVETHQTQNDGETWKVDKDTLLPIEPVNKELFIELGISTNPANIPLEKTSDPITIKKAEEQAIQREIISKQKEILELQEKLLK